MSKRRRSNYTDEFKSEAVKLVIDQGYTVAESFFGSMKMERFF